MVSIGKMQLVDMYGEQISKGYIKYNLFISKLKCRVQMARVTYRAPGFHTDMCGCS